jgi:hypothetical protein
MRKCGEILDSRALRYILGFESITCTSSRSLHQRDIQEYPGSVKYQHSQGIFGREQEQGLNEAMIS